MSYLTIIGIAEIVLSIGLLSDKKERQSKLKRILSYTNLILGVGFVVWGFFVD